MDFNSSLKESLKQIKSIDPYDQDGIENKFSAIESFLEDLYRKMLQIESESKK